MKVSKGEMYQYCHYRKKLFKLFNFNAEVIQSTESFCAAYESTPTLYAADFLELAENCTFLHRKLISVINEFPDGHQLAGWAR